MSPVGTSWVTVVPADDIYPIIDKNVSESQVGARKKRSFREHLLILYSVINSAVEKESKPIDSTTYDLKKAFDSLDLVECCNDIWEAGVTDDKMALIWEGGQVNNVAINTPIGQTARINIPVIVPQGGNLGPIICGNQVDTIGRESLRDSDNLYKYKNSVPIPQLSMIDDLLNISECGIQSVEGNAIVNIKIEMKKLEFNENKCNNIHVGAHADKCPILKAHDQIIVNTTSDKYVGDIISSNGSNKENITSRVNKGLGAISTIMNILKEDLFISCKIV